MEPGLSRGPGVEVVRVVPGVWYSSRMVGSRSGEAFRSSCIRTRGFESHGGHHYGTWSLTGSRSRGGEGGPGGLVLVADGR